VLTLPKLLQGQRTNVHVDCLLLNRGDTMTKETEELLRDLYLALSFNKLTRAEKDGLQKQIRIRLAMELAKCLSM